MSFLHAIYSKGQVKIQQMAFVLIAMIIFFIMAGLIFVAIYYSSLQKEVEGIREQEVKEIVRRISGSPEFSWLGEGDCAACIDFDKVFLLKTKESYQNFWRGIPYLEISKVYPSSDGECNTGNYPNCGSITIIDSKKNFIAHSAFVALCYYEPTENYVKCELGKVTMGFETT